MAERRMFSKTIIDSDMFLDMPTSSRLLYFDLSMRADDDGFVNSPKKIIRMTGASQDDLKLLIAKSFIIPFESGVVVIKHWKIHNYIRNDRYKPTICQEEKAMLKENVSKEYVLDDGIPLVDQTETQDRLDKDRLEQDSKGKESIGKTKEPKHKYGEYSHVLLTDTDRKKLIDQYGEKMMEDAITFLDEYIEMKGYKTKNHYLAIRKWVIDAVNEQNAKRKKGASHDTEREADEDKGYIQQFIEAGGRVDFDGF